MTGVETAIVLITGGTTIGIEVLNAFLRFGLIVGFTLGIGWAAIFLPVRSPVLGMTSLSSGRLLEGG